MTDREDSRGDVPRELQADRAEAPRPRSGMKRSLMHVIRQIPSYVRLLIGLIGDGRVSKLNRVIVLGAVAYMVFPLDFVPDFIPFLGEVDDVFLLVTALQRLIGNAGRAVLLDHWRGDPDEIEDVNLARIVSAAGFFLPARLRRRLRRMAGAR